VRERGEYDEKWGRRRRRQGEERRGGKGRVIGKGFRWKYGRTIGGNEP